MEPMRGRGEDGCGVVGWGVASDMVDVVRSRRRGEEEWKLIAIWEHCFWRDESCLGLRAGSC